MNAVLWMAVSACLLTACVMDCLSGEVYNFIWWIGGAAAALLLCRRGISVGRLFALGCFCLLQLTIFAKMYGKADCYAFCVCALTLAAAGWGFPEFLFQMILAFGILAVVQLFRRNIDKVGNL